LRHAGHRHVVGIQETDLHKNGSLIPVDVLIASLPSRNCTMATTGTSTLRPVGGTPGSIQSISEVCVKLNSISSTKGAVQRSLQASV